MPTKDDLWRIIHRYQYSAEASIAASIAHNSGGTTIPLEAVHAIQVAHDNHWRQLEQALATLTKEAPNVVPKETNGESDGHCTYCHGTEKVYAERWNDEDEIVTTYLTCPACQEPRTSRVIAPWLIEWLNEDPLEVERWMKLTPGTMDMWTRYLNHCFRKIKADISLPKELDDVIQAMIDDIDDPYAYY